MDYIRKMISKTGIKAETLTIIDQNNYLLNLRSTDTDIEEFSFGGYKTWARCFKVMSADSLIIAFFYNNKPYKFHVKLANVYVPNLESQNNLETRIARITLQRLKDFVEDKLIFIECIQHHESINILHVKIYKDNITTKSYNQQLVEDGLATDHCVSFKEWFEINKK